LQRDIENLTKYWEQFNRGVEILDQIKLFQPLLQFFKQYYEKELSLIDEAERRHEKILPSMKSPYDFVKVLRAQGFPNISENAFLNSREFAENVITGRLEFNNSEKAREFFE
jgi:hypothetical protein